MKNLSSLNLKKCAAFIVAFFLFVLGAEEIMAQYIHNDEIRRDVRGTARRSARRVERRHDIIEGDVGYVAPVAAAAAVTTAAILYSLPHGCIDRSGIYDCNGIRYRPQYQGANLVYIQVND
ncbi:hypothetical protein I5M27_05865 [Adhaeribacter sp. BT258]|uniref:Uncharacterized protein n=1 Tax=Adhaeribacter terrigena TaxID=2793070 RepID=A0ABS1BZL9_9BACT|nr:hypothetical protein [Adhaeribacter terrigena]MBK0402503.1 hypothetical protein [Adhaeribacter terrigena]